MEAADGLAYGYVPTLLAGELLGHEEGLREEALYLPRTRDGLPVFLRQFLNAQDGDDVLQIAIALEHLLNASRGVIVLLANDCGFKDSRVGGQRVDRRVQGLLGQRTVERNHGVEVSERRHDTGVGVVVGGNVDGLERGNRAGGARSDPLLEVTHLGAQGRLVPDRGGHPP